MVRFTAYLYRMVDADGQELTVSITSCLGSGVLTNQTGWLASSLWLPVELADIQVIHCSDSFSERRRPS